MPQDCICGGDSKDFDEPCLFQSKNDMDKTLSRLCYGDCYIIGRLWIEALKTVLVGSSMCLLPVVKAEKPSDKTVPEKPPKMRYTDLPIYESPHRDYQCYMDDVEICPDYKNKIMHSYLLPRVKVYRQQVEQTGADMKSYMQNLKKDFCGTINASKDELKKYMRDPQNLQLSRAVVASGALTGLYLGKTIPRRLFLASLGTLATGALCFPEETDEGLRQALYYSGKALFSVYNLACSKNVMYLKDPIDCPPPPEKKQ